MDQNNKTLNQVSDGTTKIKEGKYPWAECANPFNCPAHCDCFDKCPSQEVSRDNVNGSIVVTTIFE